MRLRPILALIASFGLCHTVLADSAEIGGVNWSFVVKNGEVWLGDGTFSGARAVPENTKGELSIPSEIAGHPVVGVCDFAFHSCSLLLTVRIPEGVRSVGDAAFISCTSLERVELPSSLTNIVFSFEGNPFNGCTALRSITVDPANRFYESENGVLYDKGKTCLLKVPSQISDYALPHTVTTIGNGAFDRCQYLRSIKLLAPVAEVKSYAFSSDMNLNEVVCGATVTNIGKYAFNACLNLGSLTFYCDNPLHEGLGGPLPKDVIIYVSEDSHNWGVEIPGEWNGYRIRHIPLPEGGVYTNLVDGVSWIFTVRNGSSAVAGIASGGSRTRIVIPAELGELPVSSICQAAFSDRVDLAELVVPETVTEVGERVFEGCANLRCVTFLGECPITAGNLYEGLDCTSASPVTYVRLSIGSWQHFLKVGEWMGSPIRVDYTDAKFSYEENGDGSISITGGSWEGVAELLIPSVYDGKTVSRVANYSFYGRNDIASVTIDIPFVDSGAFHVDDSLRAVRLTSMVVSVGDWAFACDGSLTYLDIGEGVEEFGADSFYMTSLGNVICPRKLANIGAWAFAWCQDLTNVVLSAELCTVPDHCFYGCGSLKKMQLPTAVRSIGEAALHGLGLEEIELDPSVTNIGEEAFSYCASLTNILFKGDAPVAVGDSAFNGVSQNFWFGAYDDAEGWPVDGQWQGHPLILLDREAALNHKVSFDADGGTPLPEELVRREGEPIGELPTVEKYGYEFMGWHSNSVEGVQFCDATIMPSGDLLLVAVWERKSYTITFESGVGSPVSPIVRLYQDSIGELPTIESPGRHFVGWFADPEGMGEQIKADMLIEGCMTLYAGWAKSCMVDGRVWVYDDVAGRVRIHSMQIDGDVSVPDALDGLPVRDIPDACFANCSNLTSVTLPASVTNIGAYAFYNCVKLKDVVFNEGLVSIGDGAFAKCESIEKVTLPSTIRSIGSRLAIVNPVAEVSEKSETHYSFETNYVDDARCARELRSSQDETVCSACNTGRGVFECCLSLKEVELNEGLESIGAGAFKGCKNLAGLVIPDNISSIGGLAETLMKSTCESNSSAYDLLQEEGDRPSILTSESIISNACSSCEHVDSGFLEGCSALCSVKLPKRLKYLGPNSFAGCSKLTSVDLPDSLTVINRGTFSRCKKLSMIRFPADLELIGGNELPYSVCESFAFDALRLNGGDWSVLTQDWMRETADGHWVDSLRVNGGKPSVLEGDEEDRRWSPDPQDVRVPVDEAAFLDWFYRWKGAQVLNNILCPLSDDERNKVRTRFASVRPSEPSFGSPDCGVFYGCSSLREVCLPQSVRRIADYSFYDCCNLVKIELPKRLDLLGYQVFGGETALMDIATPWFDFGSLWEVFPSHSYVTNLVILSSPPHIMDPNDAFKTVMKDILGEAITLEEANARMIPLSDDERRQVGRKILEGLWITQDEVLYGFQNLKSLTLPEGLRSFDWTIGWWSTQKLLDVALPNTLTCLGWRAFAGFPVEHITIPSSLQTIEDEAFLESNVCDVLFTGNAPCDVSPNVFVETSGWDPYYAAREDLVVSVYPGTTGWDGEAESAALPTDGLWPAHAAVYKRRPIQFVWQPVSAALGGEGGADALTYFDATLDRLVTVPQTWLNSYGLLSVDAAGAASVSSLSPIASRSLYDSYVAGLDPSDKNSQFKVKIEIVNNEPVITWEPELTPAEAAKRKYTVYGCTELGGDWYNVDEVPDDIKAQLCFFKIGVEMR